MIKDNKMDKTPEQYFFRYAFPCAEVLLQTKRIDQKRFDELKSAIDRGATPSREVLEDTFRTAFENMKGIAKREGKDHWDISVIRRYFEEGHNMFIDSGGGYFGKSPESIKDMCRIKEAVVGSIIGDAVKVKYGSKERMCRNIYRLGLKKGDKVRMHYGYIIERIG